MSSIWGPSLSPGLTGLSSYFSKRRVWWWAVCSATFGRTQQFLLRQKEQNYRSTEFLLAALIVTHILCDNFMPFQNSLTAMIFRFGLTSGKDIRTQQKWRFIASNINNLIDLIFQHAFAQGRESCIEQCASWLLSEDTEESVQGCRSYIQHIWLKLLYNVTKMA